MAHPFSSWLKINTTQVRHHNLHLLVEQPGVRPTIGEELNQVVRGHYIDPSLTQQRLAELGAPKTAKLFKERLPKNKKARSGELGEILSTEIAENYLGYRVPIRRLRWKDSREMALRGDDIVGISQKARKPLAFLKGESKSRKGISDSVIASAAEALDRNHGRPTRLSILFVAERLRERDEIALAGQMEKALLDSFRSNPVEHMLCAISGNDPTKYLQDHLDGCKKRRIRHAVGLRIDGHQDFIKEIYSNF